MLLPLARRAAAPRARTRRQEADDQVAVVDQAADGGEVARVEREAPAVRGAGHERRGPVAVDVGHGHREVGAREQVGDQRPRHHAGAEDEYLLHGKLLRETGSGVELAAVRDRPEREGTMPLGA